MPHAEGMQGTVANFNEDTSGEVVLDSPPEHAGRRVRFDAAAFAVSGLRFLRPGQRVALEWTPADEGDEAGRVTAVRIPTMGS
jgi:cold shock CspA family protein